MNYFVVMKKKLTKITLDCRYHEKHRMKYAYLIVRKFLAGEEFDEFTLFEHWAKILAN